MSTDEPTTRRFVHLVRAADCDIETTEFGRLEWIVAGRLGSSTTMTVGRCYIEVGRANPRHLHPNCDEVLHVLQGNIDHSAGDEMVQMGTGDTISIPAGVPHNARNVGSNQVILLVSFSSPDRQVVVIDQRVQA